MSAIILQLNWKWSVDGGQRCKEQNCDDRRLHVWPPLPGTTIWLSNDAAAVTSPRMTCGLTVAEISSTKIIQILVNLKIHHQKQVKFHFPPLINWLYIFRPWPLIYKICSFRMGRELLWVRILMTYIKLYWLKSWLIGWLIDWSIK